MVMFWAAFVFFIALFIKRVFELKKHAVPGEKFIFWDRASFSSAFALLIYTGILFAYNNFVPLNQNYGIEFNSEREKLDLPVLPEKWKRMGTDYKQFLNDWWSDNYTNGHFRKTIVYGYINPKYELNSYVNRENQDFIVASSRYNFKTNSYDYWIGKSLSASYIDEDGNFEVANDHEIREITKEEFDNFIEE